MSQQCYGWMKFKVESVSPTKTPRKHRDVSIGCLISVSVQGGGGAVSPMPVFQLDRELE